MYDVTGVSVFPRKLMEFPRKEKVNSVPYPLLLCDIFQTVATQSQLRKGLEFQVQLPRFRLYIHTKSSPLWMSEKNFQTELSRITFYDYIIYP